MSHLSKVQSEMNSLPFFLMAMDALGIQPLEGVKAVRHYYANRPGQTPTTPVEMAFGVAGYEYHLGVQIADDGAIGFVGDFWGLKKHGPTKDILEKMGPGFSNWEMSTKDGIEGHVATGKPTRLMQEYHLQIGEAAGAAKGFRIGDRTTNEAGDISIRLTGGNLKGGQAVILIAYADGTIGTAAEGFDDKSVKKGQKSCEAATSWLEDMLGNVKSRQYVDDFFHGPEGQHVRNRQAN